MQSAIMPPIYDTLEKELEFFPDSQPAPACEFVVVAAMALLQRKNSGGKNSK